MTAAAQIDQTGASYLTDTLSANAILTYNGPGGQWPAGMIAFVEVTVTCWDATGGAKSFWIYDVVVTNVGGTLALLTPAAPTARSTATGAGTTQATGATFSVNTTTLAAIEARAQTGNSLRWGAAVTACVCAVP